MNSSTHCFSCFQYSLTSQRYNISHEKQNNLNEKTMGFRNPAFKDGGFGTWIYHKILAVFGANACIDPCSDHYVTFTSICYKITCNFGFKLARCQYYVVNSLSY